jgi:lathosterol oxidase
VEILRWVWNSWFLISERLILVAVAFIAVTWFQPPLEETRTLALGWIAELWLRNMALMILVAGGCTSISTPSPSRASG